MLFTDVIPLVELVRNTSSASSISFEKIDFSIIVISLLSHFLIVPSTQPSESDGVYIFSSFTIKILALVASIILPCLS